MTAIVRFRALSGAYSEGPLCYLLEVDDFHILLDCGWTDDFDVDDLEPLRPWIPKIDAVLLSHPDLTHLGALPFLVGKWGLEAPVYATIPVYKMGQMFMYDVYQAKRAVEEFEVFDLDDVDTAFDKIKQLKYSQHLSLNTGSHSTLDITPYPAGHMIGGTVWKIVKETEEIVYAVDYNHKKERHLNPTVLETLNRPTLLITDAYNALVTHSTNRSVRDVELLESVTRALQGGGNVLLPTDTAGRVLELLLCLDQHWAFYKDPRTGQPMSAFSLVLLHHESYNTIEFAKSQLEWMSSAVQKSFDEDRNNPLNFRFVRMCHNLLDLEKLPKPMAVLATMPTLQGGFALELFAMWASDPKNMVIFTDRGLDFKGEELTGTREEEGEEREEAKESGDKHYRMKQEEETASTTAVKKEKDDEPQTMEEGYGWEEKEETDKGKEKDEMDTAKRRKPKTRQLPLHRRVLAAGVPSLLQLKMKRRVPLEGDELVEFRRKEEKERQRKLQEKKEAEKKLKREKREKENQRLLKMMMEEEDFGGQVTSSMPTITIHNPFNDAYDWVPATSAPSLPTKTATLHQQQQQQIVMFPYGENRHQWDEYGQVIDVEAFIQRAAKARSAEIMEVEKRAYLNNNAAEEGKEGTKAEGGEGGEEAAKATSVPTKCIEVNVSISLNCAIKYIDFEGRSDGRSIKAILSHVAPRKVILIHGNAECLEHLRQHCLTNLKDTCKDVLCPRINESIDVTSDTNIYKIKLRETLLKSLEFVPLRKDYEIAYANGQISTTTSMMPSTTPSRTAAAATSVTHLEATKPGTLIPHPAVFVGELFLADFKEVLTQNGFKTEFSGGVLVCNGVVMLTKEKVAGGGGGSRISISGPLSRDYYKVRSLLYSQFHVF